VQLRRASTNQLSECLPISQPETNICISLLLIGQETYIPGAPQLDLNVLKYLLANVLLTLESQRIITMQHPHLRTILLCDHYVLCCSIVLFMNRCYLTNCLIYCKLTTILLPTNILYILLTFAIENLQIVNYLDLKL
jgi:hypothetical protein